MSEPVPDPLPDNPPGDGAVPPAVATRAQRRERALRDALRTLLRDHCLNRFGTPEGPVPALTMALRLTLRPDAAWDVVFDPPIEEQIDDQLADALAVRGAFCAGRVYCFRCRSSACEHSLPPSPLAVFRGYTPTGLPEWHELAQAFIEAADERVDQLYATPPSVLARVQYGRDLRRQQLSLFGRSSRTYSILGQVVVGYLDAAGAGPVAGSRAHPRAAITFQAVQIVGPDGRLFVRINPVVGGLSPEQWEERMAGPWAPSIGRPLESAQTQIESIQNDVNAARAAKAPAALRCALRRVPAVLARLARALERGSRQTRRRTRHAEQRRGDSRPVHKAMDDARQADLRALFYDEKRRTWIVCGPHGRTHVFNDGGRHVTSFTLAPDGAEFRVRTSRWRPLLHDEAARFLASLRPPRPEDAAPLS